MEEFNFGDFFLLISLKGMNLILGSPQLTSFYNPEIKVNFLGFGTNAASITERQLNDDSKEWKIIISEINNRIDILKDN